MGLQGQSLPLSIESIGNILTGRCNNKRWGQTEEMILIPKENARNWPQGNYCSIENKYNNCWFVVPLFTTLLVYDTTKHV